MKPYSNSITIALPFAQAVATTRASLQEEDFGVVMEIDVQKTVKRKLGKDILPYLILGAGAVGHRVGQNQGRRLKEESK
jgi:uncharacterized protein (DUF302 family)